jgi:hypothetical protein
MRSGKLMHWRASGVLGLVAAALAATALTAPPALADGPGKGAPWVVSVGDSYISGEAGRWAGNTNDSYTKIDALGPTAYFDNATHTAEKIPGCHRSSSAEVFIGGGVQSLNLACSGATTTTDATGTDFKPGLDFYNRDGHQGQAKMLEDFARTHNVRMIPLSIGGNNFQFADIVKACLTDYLTPFVFSPYTCNADQAAKISADNVAKRIAEIKTGILNIHQAMRNDGYTNNQYAIVVQDYEAAIPSAPGFRYAATALLPPPYNRPRQNTGGCGFTDADANWANATLLPTIDLAVHRAANQANLSNVKFLQLIHAFDGRRLCAKRVGLLEEKGLASWRSPGAVDNTEWVNQIRTVTIGTPYFQQESLHPNYWGQLALRNCLRQVYDGGTPRGGTCRIAGPGLDAQREPRMILTS